MITITDIDSENIIEKNERVRVCSKKIVKSIDKKNRRKKRENNQNISLIDQLSKTIADNSKVLAEFGLGLSVLSKIKSLITISIMLKITMMMKIKYLTVKTFYRILILLWFLYNNISFQKNGKSL